eukprot:105664_1
MDSLSSKQNDTLLLTFYDDQQNTEEKYMDWIYDVNMNENKINTWKCSNCNHINNSVATLDVKCTECDFKQDTKETEEKSEINILHKNKPQKDISYHMTLTDMQKHSPLSSTQQHKTFVIEFIEWKSSDYIDCQNNDHEVIHCPVIKRILTLLKYYHQQRTLKNDPMNIDIYQYLLSLKNYDIPRFMEDWYQVKKHHLRDPENMTQTRSALHFGCNVTNCEHVIRFSRVRENDTYT